MSQTFTQNESIDVEGNSYNYTYRVVIDDGKVIHVCNDPNEAELVRHNMCSARMRGDRDFKDVFIHAEETNPSVTRRAASMVRHVGWLSYQWSGWVVLALFTLFLFSMYELGVCLRKIYQYLR